MTDAARIDPIPSWVAYSGVAGVGGTALAVLAYYQHEFAEKFAKMPWLLSWTFSIGLDWGSAVAGIFWFFGAGALAVWGRWIAITLVAGSTVLTCIAWGMLAGWVFAPLGVIHPLVAFAMAKLLTLWQADRRTRRGQVDALDSYRADLERRRAELVGYHRLLTAATTAAAAELAEQAARAAVAEAAARDAELAALEATRPARIAAPAPTKTVPPAGGEHRPPAGGDNEDVALLAAALEFIQAADAAGDPFGQRPFAEHVGKSRDRIRVPHTAALIHLGKDVARVPEQARQDARALLDAARDVLDTDSVFPHVNGRKYPTPTTGATS